MFKQRQRWVLLNLQVDKACFIDKRECIPEIGLGNKEIFHQDRFNLFFLLCGNNHCPFHLLGRNDIPINQFFIAHRDFFSTLIVVEQGYCQGVSQFFDSCLVDWVKLCTLLFVNEFDNPHQVRFMNDWCGQDLFGATATFLIPGWIEAQGRVYVLQLIFVIDIRYIERLLSFSDKAGYGWPIDIHSNFT